MHCISIKTVFLFEKGLFWNCDFDISSLTLTVEQGRTFYVKNKKICYKHIEVVRSSTEECGSSIKNRRHVYDSYLYAFAKYSAIPMFVESPSLHLTFVGNCWNKANCDLLRSPQIMCILSRMFTCNNTIKSLECPLYRTLRFRLAR